MEGFQKGVNLGGWFSQLWENSEENYRSFITESDFERIASWGMDHVRVPADYTLVETEEGAYKPEGFAHLDRCVQWCRKYHLNMILDSTLAWFRDIHSVFEKYGIGHAAWNYKERDYGLIGEHYAPILDELLKVL